MAAGGRRAVGADERNVAEKPVHHFLFADPLVDLDSDRLVVLLLRVTLLLAGPLVRPARQLIVPRFPLETRPDLRHNLIPLEQRLLRVHN